MRVLTKKGQSMAEYAILFAIVIGAAIAMQQYIKSRLQGGMRAAADGYTAALSGTGNLGNVNAFEPDRSVNAESNQTDGLVMTSATAGTRTLNTDSDSTSTVTK